MTGENSFNSAGSGTAIEVQNDLDGRPLLTLTGSHPGGDPAEITRLLQHRATARLLAVINDSLRAVNLLPQFTIVPPYLFDSDRFPIDTREPLVVLSGNKWEVIDFDSTGQPHRNRVDANRAIRALKRKENPPQLLIVGDDDTVPTTFYLDEEFSPVPESEAPESAVEQSTEEQPATDLVQLRFADEHNNIKNLNAAEMASVLQGLVEITSQIHKTGAFGDGLSPEVRVRPPKEGSFIVEVVMTYQAIMDWSSANPEAAIALAGTAGATFAKAVQTGKRILQGNRPVHVADMADGQVSVQWQDGGTNTMPQETWEKLNVMSRPTKRAFRKLLAPLSDEADSLEVREGSSRQSTDQILLKQPTVQADRNDYRAALSEPDDTTESVRTFEAEAQLQSVDFQSGEKWRIKTLDGTRNATIEDQEFLRKLDNGLALHKNDIFNVTIRETTTTANGRTSRDWVVTEVIRVRNGGVDSNDGQSASS